jgi:hypothetical protein
MEIGIKSEHFYEREPAIHRFGRRLQKDAALPPRFLRLLLFNWTVANPQNVKEQPL